MLTVMARKGCLHKMIKLLQKIPTWALALGIVIVIVLDQWTKSIASGALSYANPVEVLPVLNWTLLHNHGAAFSFLSDQGGWQRWFFTAVSSIVSLVFFVWLIKLPQAQYLNRLSLMFIIGGAIGNLIDRVTLGYVVDFVSVHWQNYFYPAFNVADMAITFGAILMISDMLFTSGKES
jgi:signal peptidase II